MNPYLCNEEHLSDIQALVDHLKKSYASFYEAFGLICEKERLTTDLFLPSLHLRKLYQNQDDHPEYLYLAIGLALSNCGLSLEEALPMTDAGSVPFHDDPWLALFDESGTKLKNRIASFIRKPWHVWECSWLSLYYAEAYAEHSAEKGIVTNGAVLDAIRRIAAKYGAENAPHIIWVWGKRGSGRKSHIACALNNSGLLLVDAVQLAELPDFERAVQDIVLESKLTGAMLCFDAIGAIAKNTARFNYLLYAIRSVAKIVFFVDESPCGGLDLMDYGSAEVYVPMPSQETALHVWRVLSARFQFDRPPDFSLIAAKYSLTPLEIKRSLEKASNVSVMKGRETIHAADLYEVCEKTKVNKLTLLGKPVRTDFNEKDIVLPQHIKTIFDDVVARVAHSNQVMLDWGFSKKAPYGQGVSLLIEGPPGTGKTMAAQVLANRLGLPMYKIDMSGIVSKYIGETEKNLSVVFEEAKEAACILFFDEADALFAKRTDIKDSKDRYANLETAFLLQKLEESNGLCILATNLLQHFDNAFKRRFHYIIRLPFPDAALRRKIWDVSIPDPVPRSKDLDFDYLAEHYKLCGGNIKNIVLSAAFKAAAQGESLSMKHLLEAINDDAEKNGL